MWWHLVLFFVEIPDGDDPVSWKSLTGEVPPKTILSRKFWDLWKALNYPMPQTTSR